MTEFKIMSSKGDTAVNLEGEAAQVKFDELVAGHMIPMALEGPGQYRAVQEYSMDLERVYWFPKLQAG